MQKFFEFTVPNLAHFTIPSYALFAMIGLLFFMLFLYVRVGRVNMLFKHFLTLILFMVIGVGIGSKLLFFITRIPYMLADFSVKNVLYTFVTGGFVFYGGLLGAILGLIAFSKLYKIKFSTLGNIVTPGFPLFHMWGRVGCFFAGCCYGRASTWGVALQDDPDFLRIPVQLFESVCLLCIFLLLLYLERVRQGNIHLLSIYLLLYAVCRFVLEIFRGDTVRGIWFGLSTSQWISIGLLIGVLCYLLKIGTVLHDCLFSSSSN